MINHFLLHYENFSGKEYYDIDYEEAQFFSMIYELLFDQNQSYR